MPQAAFGNIAIPENGHCQEGKQFHLRPTAGYQRHAKASQPQPQRKHTTVFHGSCSSQQPEPQPQHQQRRTAEDGIFVDIRAFQQIVQLAAQHQRRHTQQVGGRGSPREPAAYHLAHHAEASQQEHQPQNYHAGRIGQVLDAGNCLKGQLEQQTGYNAEIDVISAVIIGMVPTAALDLGRVAFGGIIGIVQFRQRRRRVFFQIQTAVEQAVRQCTVLLIYKADGTFTVPVCGIVMFCGKAGITRLPERHHDHKSSHHSAQHQCHAPVTYISGQPAALPKTTGRAQPVYSQQGQKNSHTAQQREIHSPGRIGRNAGHGHRHRILGIGAAVSAGRQGQRSHVASQIQADGVGPRCLCSHLPGAEGVQLAVGFIGGFDFKEQRAVGVQGVGIIIDQTINMQVVNRLVYLQKTKVAAILVQRVGSCSPPHIHVGVQIIHQLERLVAVGIEIRHIAHKYFGSQRRHQKNRHHKAQTAPSKGTQRRNANTGPTTHGGNRNQAKGIKPFCQPGPMVGTKAEHPYGSPKTSHPSKIPCTHTAAFHKGRRQSAHSREKGRCNERQNQHHSLHPLSFLFTFAVLYGL